MTLHKVFVNRTLNLKKIKYIGLDMDHTLIRYNSQAFEDLAFHKMCEKLVANYNYPKAVLDFKFDFDCAIRGLVLDGKNGNILKVSRHGAIRMSKHGTEAIPFAKQQKLYKSIYIDLQEQKRYYAVDTIFSISLAVLYSLLVDLKDSQMDSKIPSYATMVEQLIECMDECHTDGSIKKQVAENLESFVHRDPQLVANLERYRKHGKKIFILTNSDFEYTKLLLDYAITPFLKEYDSWIDLFEFTIVSAKKPRFFYENHPLLRIDPKTGSTSDLKGKLEQGVYLGGSAKTLTRDLEVDGDDILYIGDHIYGDILRLKKHCNWRTALVVEELGSEVEALVKALPQIQQIRTLMDEKHPIEQELVDLISERIEGISEVPESKIIEYQQQITAIDKRVSELIIKQQKLFNSHWGEVMRAGNEESYLAHQVDRFACVYMAKLGDLLELSPRTYFRAHRRPLAHELPYHI